MKETPHEFAVRKSQESRIFHEKREKAMIDLSDKVVKPFLLLLSGGAVSWDRVQVYLESFDLKPFELTEEEWRDI